MFTEHPPTEEESTFYAIEKTLDDINSRLDKLLADCAETERILSEPLPRKPGIGLLNVILLWLVLVFALAAVYKASAQGNPVTRCATFLAAEVNPRLMGPTTATREARVACEGIRRRQSSFFKGLTQ